jgi:uncharacterized protein
VKEDSAMKLRGFFQTQRLNTRPLLFQHSGSSRNASSHSDESMSSLVHFNFDDLGTPQIGAPLPERVVEGAQVFKTWEIDHTEGGDVRTGVWEVTTGAYRCIKGTTWELCLILSGVSEITEDGKEPFMVRAGDTFVLKPGFEGTWRVIEPTRKVWVSKDQAVPGE